MVIAPCYVLGGKSAVPTPTSRHQTRRALVNVRGELRQVLPVSPPSGALRGGGRATSAKAHSDPPCKLCQAVASSGAPAGSSACPAVASPPAGSAGPTGWGAKAASAPRLSAVTLAASRLASAICR